MAKIDCPWRLRSLHLLARLLRWQNTLSIPALPRRAAYLLPPVLVQDCVLAWLPAAVDALAVPEAEGRAKPASLRSSATPTLSVGSPLTLVHSRLLQAMLDVVYAAHAAVTAAATASRDGAGAGAGAGAATKHESADEMPPATPSLHRQVSRHAVAEPTSSLVRALEGGGGRHYGALSSRVDVHDVGVLWAAHTMLSWSRRFEVSDAWGYKITPV